MTKVRAHERKPSAKVTAHREHVRKVTDLMRKELAVEEAKKKLNEFHVGIGYRRRDANDLSFEPGASEGLL